MLLSEHVLDMLEFLFYLLEGLRHHFLPGLGIYKREKKTVRKQENTHSFKKTCTRSRKKELVQEKKELFLESHQQKKKKLTFGRFHGRERVFLSEFFS